MKKISKNDDCVRYILENLRKEDKEEVIASKGQDYKEKIFGEIIKTDFDCLIGKHDKNPIVMGGVWAVDKNNPDFGCGWLLSTDEIKNYQISFFRHLKKIIKEYDKKYFIIYNYIHKNNISSQKWLKRFGFVFGDFANVPSKKDFIFFYRINPSVKTMKGLRQQCVN